MTDESSGVVAEVFQNEYLPEGATVADAVVTVTAGAGAGAGRGVAAGAPAAEVIMIDCSGSMSGERIVQARKAAAVAVDTLRDGVAFAVVAGSDWAQMVYPEQQVLAIADDRTRSAAKQAIRHLKAGGGTQIGTWLTLARELFLADRAEIRHAILLTDGRNGESTQTFRAALDRCAGLFVCDSRGVGQNWSAAELIQVAEALLGTADGMKDPAGLEEDFRSMIEAAMGKTVAGVALRVWTPAGAPVAFFTDKSPPLSGT